MADIKLKDFSGETQPYNNVEKIWLESADSTEEFTVLIPFAYGEPISQTVDPDFSNGNMIVDIPEGQLISELMIRKPVSLIPDNILKDVNVAGIIGTASGDIIHAEGAIIRSGKFQSPPVDIIYSGPSFWVGLNGAERDYNGFWKRTTSNVSFKLETNVKYYVTYRDEYKYAAPTYHGSFSSYGSCLTIGNEYLATKRQEDNTRERFLVIYIPGTNKLVEMLYDPAKDELNDGDFTADRIEIFVPENSLKSITVKHGMSTMPDFVMVWANVAGFAFGALYNSAWGVKTKLSNIMYNNEVGVFNYGPLGFATKTNGLDAAPGSSPYLYCKDNLTFTIPPSTVNPLLQMSPSSSYGWIAIWGIDSK